MSKTLRICLAMGGGVSLGSFSGAALTEALKLLILYGRDKKGQPYNDIVVDGMSGASAGAMALTIMLRCLIDYKSMIQHLDGISEETLLEDIAKSYFEGNQQAKNHRHIEVLKALELAQKIQYQIWVKDVNTEELLGRKDDADYKPDPNRSFGLLDREFMENAAKKYLMLPMSSTTLKPLLLDKERVIFACSLTNLLPIAVKIPSKDASQLERNVLKSVGSKKHSELRVIDFVFDENKVSADKATDERWIKFCEEPKQQMEFKISDPEAWATISASALACGAFPIAFEPVLLKRYRKEFGKQWPASFKEIKKEMNDFASDNSNFELNSFFNESSDNTLDYESFNFPYIDGGTFNNEPIREAFKIGNFQDFGRFNKDEEERIVLFVDPIVRQEEHPSFKVSAFSPVNGSAEGQTKLKSELSKLGGNVSSIIGVLINQGSIKEEHKIIGMRENFNLRDTIFNYLDLNEQIKLNTGILNTAFNKLASNLKGNIISLGTRDPIQYFKNELQNNCNKQGANTSACLRIDQDVLGTVGEEVRNGSLSDIDLVFKKIGLTDPKDQNIFSQTVFKVITDIALNTDGKNEDALRVAILPINTHHETIMLPGEEIQAFAGFASKKARQYAFEFARLSTFMSLIERDGFRKDSPLIDGDLKNLKLKLTANIEAINFYGNENSYSAQLEKGLFAPMVKRIKRLVVKNKLLNFLLLKSPFAVTSILGTALLPFVALFSFGASITSKLPWRGSNVLNKLIRNSADSVNYLNLEPVIISVLSDVKLNKKVFVKCSDHGKVKKRKAAETKINGRYQYLFAISLLEYMKIDNRSISTTSISSNATSIKLNDPKQLGLSLAKKIKRPKNIDGNLKPADMRRKIEDNFYDIITQIRIDRYNLPVLTDAINSKSASLHYSLKYINYHVNPFLEIDLQKINNGWYFKEQTESLHKSLLR